MKKRIDMSGKPRRKSSKRNKARELTVGKARADIIGDCSSIYVIGCERGVGATTFAKGLENYIKNICGLDASYYEYNKMSMNIQESEEGLPIYDVRNGFLSNSESALWKDTKGKRYVVGSLVPWKCSGMEKAKQFLCEAGIEEAIFVVTAGEPKDIISFMRRNPYKTVIFPYMINPPMLHREQIQFYYENCL